MAHPNLAILRRQRRRRQRQRPLKRPMLKPRSICGDKIRGRPGELCIEPIERPQRNHNTQRSAIPKKYIKKNSAT